jgi:citronellyl-CoA dehydrogenase
MAIGVQTDMATPALARFGSDLVHEEFLRPSVSGEKIACLGVSEVGGGSDVAALKTTAKKDGDDYIINGGKMWTTTGTQADWMCCLANTAAAEDVGGVHRNKTLICVPMDAPGVQIARTIDKLGMRSSDTAQVFFEDVRVPQSFRIGDEGEGFMYQMLQFQEERLFCGAIGLRVLDRCVQGTADYCAERKAFGKPLLANQALYFRLAELQTEIEALRSLIYRATSKHVTGDDVTLLASMVKLKIGRLSREVTDSCLQYWGGMGFTNEVEISRAFRDMRLTSIGGGADEVMMEIIAKEMFFSKK